MGTLNIEKYGFNHTGNIFRNNPPGALVEKALLHKEGRLSRAGALCIETGERTGRSPDDKYIVDTPAVHDLIAWGNVNRPVSREVFDIESYPVDNIAMAVGGDAMNESTIISRLGFKTGLMAAIGDDAAGAFILRSCDEDNIDTEGVTIDPNLNTSINIGLVTEDGERTFITNRNGSLWKENIEHVNFHKIKEAKILSLASIFNCPLLDGKTLEVIFKFAKEQGMTITADMIMPRLGETLDDIAGALKYVDYFFPNYDEACLMTGEKDEAKVADKLFAYGIKNVVMKIGKRGCYIRNKDGVMIVPACKGITAIDTIGAGDNFASGFIAALLQGKNLKECGEYANCTAAIAVQHPGATSGVQNREMVEEMLAKYKKDYE